MLLHVSVFHIHHQGATICALLKFLCVALRPNAGHGHLILEVPRSHTQRRTTVGRTPLGE